MSTSNQASAPSTQDGKEAWGKLISFNPNLENIVLYKDAFSIGRNPTNDVKISDIKLSGIHCKIYKDEGGCWIEDLSSNGTYVDNDLIGKGNKRKITSGDKLYILHPNKVKKEEVMGYVFSAMATENSGELKRKREEELKTLEEEKKKSEKQIKFQEELGEEMQCSICIDYIYHCVTTIPCLHNFCAACFSDWMQKSQVCPQCREEVVEVKKNNTVNNIIEKFMENNPTKKRPKEEYEEMDKKNKIKEDRLVLKNKTNPTQPISNPVRAAAPPAATHFNPLAHTVVNMFNPNPLPTFVSTANAASRVNYFAPVPAPTTASSIFTNRIPATGSHARGMRARGGRAGARSGGGRDSAYRPYNRGRYGRYGYGSDEEYSEEEDEDDSEEDEESEISDESEYSD